MVVNYANRLVLVALLLMPFVLSLTTPTRVSFLSNFFTCKQCSKSATSKLLTSATSACSSGTGYRSETFIQPFVVTGLDTTNRMQIALGITDLFFDFTSSNFTWDVSVASFNATSMNVLLYVSGTNIITYLGISYLVSSNLLFDIGYSQKVFTGNQTVYFSQRFCYKPEQHFQQFHLRWRLQHQSSESYQQNVQIYPSQSPLQSFSHQKHNCQCKRSNILDWNHCLQAGHRQLRVQNKWLKYQLYLLQLQRCRLLYSFSKAETTQIYTMNIYYVVFERDTIRADITSILFDGNGGATNNCWYSNNTPCKPGPNYLWINGAGPQYTPYVFLIGFNKLYTTADAGHTGNFQMTAASVSALNTTNFLTQWLFTGNPDHNYQLAASYLVYQKITCQGNPLDIYLTIDRLNCNVTCNANIEQYSDSDNLCQNCTGNCYCCQTTSSQCTACIAGSNRILNVSTCICNPNGYYQETINVSCVACHYTCITCTSWTNASCTSCNLTLHQRLIQTNACPCIDGYYDAGLAICTACDQTCLTCSASGPAACLSCSSSLNRYLTGSSCLCSQFFFDNGTASCTTCHYSCVTCSNVTYLDCLTCNASAYRFLSGTGCVCKQGYYDVGPQVMLCAPCDPTCFICNGPLSTNCYLICDATKFRNLIGSECKCIAQYYEYLSTCSPCDITCQNCTAAFYTGCSTCLAGSFRSLVGTRCVCNDGYYQARQINCLPCSYTCQTCNVSSSQCTSCNSTEHRALAGSACLCESGYYDSGSAICQTCHYSCITCWASGVAGCSSCDTSIRYAFAGQCLCLAGTFDNSVNTTCNLCDYSCLSCSAGTSLSCTSCNNTFQRMLVSNTCSCNIGYYDTGINQQQCQACSIICMTCSLTSTNCTSCNPSNFRGLIGNSCMCLAHYYENGLAACPACLSTCLNCTIFSVCTACDAIANFRMLFSGVCVCEPGYFDTGSTVCATCSYKCLTCNSSSTNCIACNSSALRTQGSGTCDCLPGYYDNGVTMCVVCHYSCDTCNGGLATFCLSCNSTALRNLSASQCLCQAGYYDTGSIEMCQTCSYACLTCSGSSTVCSSCDSASHRALSGGQCVCQQGFYESGVSQCSTCSFICLSCSGPLPKDCITCQPTNFRALNGTFSCVCQQGYFETGTASCAVCSMSCLTCQTTSDNCTSCQSGTLRTLIGNACVCISGYFDDGSATCSSCNSKCATCNISSTNCLSCNVSQLTVLDGNTCVCVMGAYVNVTTGLCLACHFSCANCSASYSTSCLTCSSANNRRLAGNICICNDGYFEQGISLCGKCYPSCLTCFGGSSQYNCTSCPSGFTLFTSTCLPSISCSNYYFEGKCRSSCPNYTYPLGNVCQRCNNNCYTCINATACTSCTNNTYLSPLMTCISACGMGQYLNNSKCLNCPGSCFSCTMDTTSFATCTACLPSDFFYKGSCLSVCPANVTIVQNRTCLDCVFPCASCTALSSESCSICLSNYYLLGSSCVSPCPIGLFGSLMTLSCQICPINCTECQQDAQQSNKVICSACLQSLYPSFGTCVSIGSFNNNGLVVKCHPNCLTCTNSSFSSCIRCQALRGDSSQMAVKGYCDCVEGTVDGGEGICDQAMFASVQSANSFLVTGSASVALTTLVISAVAANPVLFMKFVTYNQLVGQMFYINSSVPASVDSLLNSSLKYNIGGLLERLSPIKVARRVLYDNSTQTVESLFLHGGTQNIIRLFSLLVIGLNISLWILMAVFYKLAPLLKAKLKSSEQSTIKVLYKISAFGLKALKFNILVYLMQLTFVETCFNVFVSIKIAIFDDSATSIEALVLSCALFVYYLAFSLFLSVKTAKANTTDINKSAYASMVSNFNAEMTKWYHRIYFSISALRGLLLQLWVVTLSFNAMAQSIAWVLTQLIYTLYAIAANPFHSPYSRLVIANQLVLTVQCAVFCAMSFQAEDVRLNYSLALIAVSYIQLSLFVLYTLLVMYRTGATMCNKYQRSNKTLNEGVRDEQYVLEEAAKQEHDDRSIDGPPQDKSMRVEDNILQKISMKPPAKEQPGVKIFEGGSSLYQQTQEDLLDVPLEDQLQVDSAIKEQLSVMKVRRRYRSRRTLQEVVEPAES